VSTPWNVLVFSPFPLIGVDSDSTKMDSPRRLVVRNGVGVCVHTGCDGMSMRSCMFGG